MRETYSSFLSLFTATGTLLCCALPALLVSLGAGAALAGLVTTLPWLVTLSRYKTITFTIAGAMLLIAGYLRWQARNAPCPVDPALAKTCSRMRRMSAIVYWLSVIFYSTGIFFAFIAPRLLYP